MTAIRISVDQYTQDDYVEVDVYDGLVQLDVNLASQSDRAQITLSPSGARALASMLLHGASELVHP
jgi:hypothetical protein